MAGGAEDGLVFQPRFDDKGLIPAIVTDARNGSVLMLAYMNAEALRLTRETGEAHFWSRSRKSLWRKGATSGETQRVVDIATDCDQDTILLSVTLQGKGVACHTGRHSCFYRRLTQGDALEMIED
ncbi:MAG: phosphoribosyl-AMP cyclohydrolase [Parvibaculaceae bacterium]